MQGLTDGHWNVEELWLHPTVSLLALLCREVKECRVQRLGAFASVLDQRTLFRSLCSDRSTSTHLPTSRMPGRTQLSLLM